MSDSLWPYESQHARSPCPSPTLRVHPNSYASSLWCHPAISSSVVPFSSCPQSLPASGSFPMSQSMRWPKYWSFSLSINPSNEIPGLVSFRMDWLDLLAVQGTHKSLLPTLKKFFIWDQAAGKAEILFLHANKMLNFQIIFFHPSLSKYWSYTHRNIVCLFIL